MEQMHHGKSNGAGLTAFCKNLGEDISSLIVA